MSLSLLQVVAAVRARRASLSAETVGYLLLGVADQVISVPREIGAADVLLGEEGTVKVGVGKLAEPERTERALRELLDALLSVASTATPALFRIGRRPASAGVEALVRELEAALIPVNRAAARRALTRLYRDTHRAVHAGPLDTSAALAWLQRAVAQSAPAPAVVPQPSPAVEPDAVSEPDPVAVDPVPDSAMLCEVPVDVFEASQPSATAVTRSPPQIDERPPFEILTRPEPALVRAAARARADVRERECGQEQPLAGTPRLGTFAMREVPAPLALPGDGALLLGADEATDRMPEVIAEPIVPLVRTAPLLDVVTAPAVSAELSADLASVVTDIVTESDEPASPLAPAVAEPGGEREARASAGFTGEPEESPGIEPVVEPPAEPVALQTAEEVVAEPAIEPVAVQTVEEAVASQLVADPLDASEVEPVVDAVDGDFELDDEIVIVVDEDLQAFEPELAPAAGEDYPVTRWWSSPEPPALTEVASEQREVEPEEAPYVGAEEPPSVAAEEQPSLDAEAPVIALESAAPELPSIPDLELPPLPEFIAWPTPVPPAAVEPALDSTSAALEAKATPDSDCEGDDAYLDVWESASNDEIWEAEPDDESDTAQAAVDSHQDADFDAAAAGYTTLHAENFVEQVLPVAEPVPAELRVLPASEAPDYAEVGWTPAPEPEPAQASLTPVGTEPLPVEIAPTAAGLPEPTPEPAPPRFAPRRSDVSELLRGFAVTEARSDRELRRDLKALAGVDLTPAAPRIRSLG